MFLLRMVKNVVFRLIQSIAEFIGALLWGIGQILYGVLILLCFVAEKTCVFWAVLPWLIQCSTGWKVVNFVVILLILGILIDLQDKLL